LGGDGVRLDKAMIRNNFHLIAQAITFCEKLLNIKLHFWGIKVGEAIYISFVETHMTNERR
jgi:hypothetical protein